MFDALKNDAAGLAILREWLGDDGVPVPAVDAVRRSQSCLQCSENVAPGWWDRMKNQVARAIRKHLEIKHRIWLSVEREKDLHMCRACGCCTRLKIWTPLKHIEAHQSAEVWAGLPLNCWMLLERESKP